MGTKWVQKQYTDYLNTYLPHGNDKDREVAYQDWHKEWSEKEDTWSYTMKKGNQKLVVKTQVVFMYDSYTSEYGDDTERLIRAGTRRGQM